MLLADFVQESAGKLYITGGGWTRVLRPDQPTPMGIAIKLRGGRVPNKERKFVAALVHKGGRAVILKNPGEKKGRRVQFTGTMRPLPSSAKSTPLDAAIAVNLVLALEPGRYEWRFDLDGHRLATWPFEVVAAPPTQQASHPPTP
jgi:hypothetical protein